MRLRFIAIVCSVVIFSCRAKDTTRAEIENDLKVAMQTYLYNAINNDSSNVKYKVLDVTYYEAPDKYLCEFQVHMVTKMLDTTGMMRADVSKDFKKVDRLN